MCPSQARSYADENEIEWWQARREKIGFRASKSEVKGSRSPGQGKDQSPDADACEFQIQDSGPEQRNPEAPQKSIANARKHGLRILHFSFQSNHVHLMLEASTNEILTRGMRSLTITFAKGLDKGRVQIERYHLHVLRTVRETKHALMYVLFNQQKHEKGICSTIDEYSSVLCFANGLDLVRKFAIRNKMILKIQRAVWIPDDPETWLVKRALTLL